MDVEKVLARLKEIHDLPTEAYKARRARLHFADLAEYERYIRANVLYWIKVRGCKVKFVQRVFGLPQKEIRQMVKEYDQRGTASCTSQPYGHFSLWPPAEGSGDGRECTDIIQTLAEKGEAPDAES